MIYCQLANAGLYPSARDRGIRSVSEPGSRAFEVFAKFVGCPRSEGITGLWKNEKSGILPDSGFFSISGIFCWFREPKLYKNLLRNGYWYEITAHFLKCWQSCIQQDCCRIFLTILHFTRLIKQVAVPRNEARIYVCTNTQRPSIYYIIWFFLSPDSHLIIHVTL